MYFVKMQRPQVTNALVGAETGTNGLPVTAIAAPNQKMQVRKHSVAGFATFGNQLTLLHGIAHIGQHTIVLQVPVTGPGAIAVLYDDVIAMRPVLFAPATTVAVFFKPHHHTAPCGINGRALFHLKIQCCPVFMRKQAEVALYNNVLSVFIRQCVYIAGIFLYCTLLQLLGNAPVRILTYRAGCKCRQHNYQ